MKKLFIKSVLLSVVLLVTATVSVHAEDWKGIDITNLSMTGDGYFEARITTNVLDQIRNQNERVSVKGTGFTLTSVDLIKSDGTSLKLTMKHNNATITSYTFTNWEKVDIDYDFSGAAAGEYIRCTYTNKADNYNCVFAYSDDWSDFTELNNSIYKDGVASNEVYIYNVETGKFMYIGGYWGTHVELLFRDFGLKFRVSTNGNRYQIKSDVSTDGGGTTGEFLGMMQGYVGNDVINNGITVDKKLAKIVNANTGPQYCYSRFKVERVRLNGESDDTYTYVLSLTPSEYPQSSYDGDNGIYDNTIPKQTTFYLKVEEEQHVVETTNAGETGHWRFVPVSEIDAAVRNAALDVDAFNGMNLDVTYKIDNQGFNRNNNNTWDQSNAQYLNTSSGNIYKLDDPPHNGKYYYGLLSSSGNGGMISRGFTAPATGWYKVQCQGVSKSGNGYAFAKSNGNDPVYAPLNVVGDDVESYSSMVSDAHKQDRVQLGIDFYDNKYPVEVYFHAEEGDDIIIGIQQMVGYDTNNDLTAFDDFQIKFLGEIFVLDEDYTDCTDENEYTAAHEGKTVILHRTFSKKDDGSYYWNTLTLPIDMTGAQVKNAFGDEVKLAEATGLDNENPYCITFQTVDANDGITAGHFYLIQPAKEPATPAEKTINIINKEITGPLYTLGRRNVSKISELQTEITDNGWNHPNHNSIRYHGTYLKKDGGVPAGSYVFSKGNMYHTKTPQTIKGFRFWIQDEEPNLNGQAKPFTLSISGVEDQQESQQVITSITEVETVADDNAGVYSLSGQFLGKGKQLLNSLPKGIYVINNKKYMVK